MDLFADPRIERLKGKLPAKLRPPTVVANTASNGASSSRTNNNIRPSSASASSSRASTPASSSSAQIKTTLQNSASPKPPTSVSSSQSRPITQQPRPTPNGHAADTKAEASGSVAGGKRKLEGPEEPTIFVSKKLKQRPPPPPAPQASASTSTSSSKPRKAKSRTASPVTSRKPKTKPKPPSKAKPTPPPKDDDSSSDEDYFAAKAAAAARGGSGTGTGTGARGTPVSGIGERESSVHAITSAARRYERFIPRSVAYIPPPSPPPPTPTAETAAEEVVGQGEGVKGREWMSSEELVQSNRSAFKQWFRPSPPVDPSSSATSSSKVGVWPPVGTQEGGDPTVELVYPGGGKERFPLLVPKINDDEYRPLDDLTRVIRTVLGYFLTPEQCLKHFSESHPISSLPSTSSQFSFLSAPPSHHLGTSTSRGPSLPPRSSRSPSAVPGLGVTSGESRGTTPQGGSSPFPIVEGEAAEGEEEDEDFSDVPLLQTLDRCKRRQDGPRFVQLINWYNRVISYLLLRPPPASPQDQSPLSALQENISSMPGLRLDVWNTITGQAYERRVGPHVDQLRKYESWSDNVYGELRPPFVSDILHLTNLGPDKIMVDLGSGVGNCVVQAALEGGVTAVGFENMQTASKLATEQQKEIHSRANQLWGVTLGKTEVHEADFTSDPRVGEWLREADVLLVNNQVFTPKLNEKLSLLFLDLKDGCLIVSLKPFVPGDFRLTGRTLDSPHAVLDQGPVRQYARNSVSWTGEGGTFYIAKVDRSRIERYLGGSGVGGGR